MESLGGEGARNGLEQAFRDPLAAAREAHARGAEVIACVGQGIPAEVIIAAGYVPTAIVPRAGAPTPLADDQFDKDGDASLKSVFEQIVGPDGAFLALAVLGPPYAQLSVMIEDLRRYTESFATVTPTAYYELPLRQRPLNQRYAYERTSELVRRLNSMTDVDIRPESLKAAIASTNRRRAAMRELIELRRQAPTIMGAAAFRLLAASSFLAAEPYTESLEAMVAGLRSAPAISGRPRLVIAPSAALTHDQAHEALEAVGALVVAENDPGGSRSADRLIAEGGDPLAAIADHYQQATLTGYVFPAERRLEWLKREAIKPDVDGVVFYAEESYFGWDYPDLKAYLAAHGKAAILVDADARTAAGRAKLEAEARPFVESLAAANRKAH